MQRLCFYIIGLLIITSCEDVIDVDVPNGEPRLVIDASFEIYLDETPVDALGGVRLTLSAPFFDDSVPTVSDATVFITNLSDNSVVNFVESLGESGFFIPEDPNVIPEFGIDYELTVIYNEETYKATTQLIPTVAIDNVEQGDGTLFDGDETEIIIFFTDDGNREDFYLFDFDFNLYLPSEDRFYQGESFNFSYFYEDMVGGEEVTIKILGIEERYFNYSNILIEQSEQDGGNPFQTPPAQIRGNIINTTNPDNYALGYFNLSEANRFQFIIEE
ncbi:DUF4249 domain-containing protein [Aquimarina litoralis]|uniref:DUF4249 domain-containing protein n=1 Tax=Aquimarina litoralis TaxID=584605 RepID=UPI001C583B63|nr:DUF4249 domain-containing protein [Aquimarina litoralis]MBW1298183.1 DUF4249 family protein [Aquimarina litoralis]